MRLADWLNKLFGARGRGTPPAEASADDGDDVDPFDPFPEPVRLEITDVFDLHAVAPREVRAVVEEYLYQARLAGFRSVRIIHGKGVGAQREAVRKILARTPFVEHFSDAPPEAGGWGATVVRLKKGDG
ncbi:MAG TPA: Smr/MutS family protein [Pyrinomonadaceae bacterium]|nr:Smr/MutS family protein [Pyrinomonadaceae bacterium]